MASMVGRLSVPVLDEQTAINVTLATRAPPVPIEWELKAPELNSEGMFDQRCWRMYKLRLRQQLLRHCHWSVTVHLLDLKPICKFELHGLVV
jgi:hypothetical protein